MHPSPKLSYRIWFTPRTGSTMLCKALEQTQVAGRPAEFFNVPPDGTLLTMHHVEDYASLREQLWQEGSTPNGVFGIKHSQFTTRYQQLLTELTGLRNVKLEELDSEEEFWADLFPNVRHIYLTRRNKIRQAVSWWKAIKTEQWHVIPGEKRKELDREFFEKEYDFDALRHLYTEAALRECAIESYFQKHDIKPLTIVYEDVCRNYQQEVQRALDFLGIAHTLMAHTHSYYQRTSDKFSEIWIEQFRKDLQNGWSHQAW